MAITFVNKTFDEVSNASDSYTFIKPSGTQANDLLIGILTLNANQATGQVDIEGVNSTLPPGWTHLGTAWSGEAGDTSSYPCQVSIFYKIHDGSEPADWTGDVGTDCNPRLMAVLAYRGTDTGTPPTYVEDWNEDAAGDLSGTINVLDADGWCLLATTFNAGAGSTVAGNLEPTVRYNQYMSNGGDVIGLGAFDSGAAIGSTGNRTRGFNANGDTNAMMYLYIPPKPTNIDGGLAATAPSVTLELTGTAEAVGTAEATAPFAEVAAEADVTATGPLDLGAPFPTYDGLGEALNFIDLRPLMPTVESDGELTVATKADGAIGVAPGATFSGVGHAPDPVFMDLAAVAPMPGMNAAGESQSAGALLAHSPMPSMSMIAETRVFGERVVIVEGEDRRFPVELDPISVHEL